MSRAFGAGALLLAAVASVPAPAGAHGVKVVVSVGAPAAPAKPQIVIVPQPVLVVPYVCFLPGYWTYQWVPQTYVYSAWVPGQWSEEGRWVEGHDEARAYVTGYYQPVWIEGRRFAC